MFEKAVRMKVRFPHRGQCSVEDLWDLSVEALDGIYRTLRSEQKSKEGDSLLAKAPSQADTILALQIDILRHVVQVKVEEAQARALAVEKREKKDHILALMAQKQDQELATKSMDELAALLQNL